LSYNAPSRRHLAGEPPRIRVPTVVIGRRNDSVTPADAARKAAQRIPNGRFALLDCNHFQPYLGDAFMENIALQLAFLQEVVPARQHLND